MRAETDGQVPDGVIYSGFSLGGISAKALAAAPEANAIQVVTFGSPYANANIPAQVDVIADEFATDVVPRLDGADNPTGWITTNDFAPTTHERNGNLIDSQDPSVHDANRYAEFSVQNPSARALLRWTDQRARLLRGALMKRAIRLISIVATVLLLAGCAPSAGQTAERASETLAAIDGVQSASANNDSAWAGFRKPKETHVGVDLASDVIAAPEFFDYLVRTAWSMNETEPTDGIFINFHSDPEGDVRDLARDAGWAVPEFGSTESVVLFHMAEIEERYGPWPGAVPEYPADALVLP